MSLRRNLPSLLAPTRIAFRSPAARLQLQATPSAPQSTPLPPPPLKAWPTFRTMTTAPPSSMKAVLIKDGVGPSSSLYIGDHDVPQPADGEVLVKVRAFGLNRMDLMQREGKYPLPPSAPKDIMGVEFSGHVVGSSSGGAGGFKAGDEVFGLATGGAYAEYIKVPTKMILHKPSTLSHEQAAAIPEAWLTAFQALKVISQLKEKEDVLIHAGASGVGLAAIQLAKAFGASGIYCTAGSAGKIATCESLGATKGFNYKAENWGESLAKQTDGKGVDVILDFIGAPYIQDNIKSLKRDGRLVFLAFMGGAKVPEFDLAQLLFKRLHLEGTTLRSRSLDYQSELVQGFVQTGMLDKLAGAVKGEDGQGSSAHHIQIHDVLDWSKIKEAHDMMAANKNTGKIIMTIPE